MYIKNRVIALIFRLALLIGCAIGLYLNSGLPQGKLNPSMLIFYTILSNLVCFIFFAFLFLKTIMEIKNDSIYGTTVLWPHFNGAIVMMITVTMLVYHFLLTPQSFTMDSSYDHFGPANILAHYYTPIMVIFDWILFCPKNIYKWFDPLIWMVIPYLYFFFALIRAEFFGVITMIDSRYPYFFIDMDVLGWGGVFKYVVLITIAFLFLSYIIFFIDRFPFKNKKSI